MAEIGQQDGAASDGVETGSIGFGKRGESPRRGTGGASANSTSASKLKQGHVKVGTSF